MLWLRGKHRVSELIQHYRSEIAVHLEFERAALVADVVDWSKTADENRLDLPAIADQGAGHSKTLTTEWENRSWQTTPLTRVPLEVIAEKATL